MDATPAAGAGRLPPRLARRMRGLPEGGRSAGLGLGGAALAGLYEPTSESESLAALLAAWKCGVRYVDTAPFYGYGLSEMRIGAFLRERPRDEFVLSTKVGRLLEPDAEVQPMDDGWARPLPFRPRFDYSRDGILRSVDDSLRRLGLDRIDLLFVHDIGRRTHGAAHETHWQALTRGGGFRALEELRRDGRIAGFGLGVNEAEVVRAALQEAPLACTLLAGRYTLLEHDALPLLEECTRHGCAIVIGGPFNSGLLAGNGKYDYADAPEAMRRRAAQLQAACAEFGVPVQAAALQFPLAHPACVSVLTGARTPRELLQNIAWARQPLPAALWNGLRDRGLIPEAAPCPAGEP